MRVENCEKSPQIRQICTNEAVTSIAESMKLRLQSHSTGRRLRAMYIAEVLSNWLSLPGELHFEYPPNRSEFIADLERIVDDKDAEEDVEKSFVEKEQESGERRPVALEVEKNIECDGPLDSDDDEDLDDEFPYRHVDAPHYIRDCIEQLNEKEDYAKFEAAFHALDPLIRLFVCEMFQFFGIF
ncbi:unnamed protein product [Gongylonema pulchrum]|uniref:Telomere_reg-2 domain-containing protein n=1 Tax=Gongylonema pulchrum TaxID=637853 RepID=A0A183D2K6_9BILA|nr:unnamed protein product [Gongylonema pulchrum]